PDRYVECRSPANYPLDREEFCPIWHRSIFEKSGRLSWEQGRRLGAATAQANGPEEDRYDKQSVVSLHRFGVESHLNNRRRVKELLMQSNGKRLQEFSRPVAMKRASWKGNLVGCLHQTPATA